MEADLVDPLMGQPAEDIADHCVEIRVVVFADMLVGQGQKEELDIVHDLGGNPMVRS